VLRVGIDTSYAPFGMLAGGQVTGIDADIAREVATRLGAQVQYVPLGFDGLYDALLTDQVDVLFSAILENPARRDRVNYSRGYFNAGLVLVSPETTPVETMTGMAGLRLSFGYGTSAHTVAERWHRPRRAFALRPYETGRIAVLAVQAGEADAALVDHTTARAYLRDNPGWQARVRDITVQPYVAATRFERADVSAAVDAALAAMLADGTLDRILAAWL
jgi:polar amino acid transport system substrate-binding protein